MNAVRKTFVKLNWLMSSQFGLDPRSFLESIAALPRFTRDWWRFRRMHTGSMALVPCLHDWYVKADATHNEYFWQDLLVAQWIFEARPRRHVDVGSRIDGFIAHVASFREVEMFDVRPVSRSIPGVTFRQADMMQPWQGAVEGYCDSLSCLHAIEHFGLGRYGDPLDPTGHERALANMARLIAPDGRLYLSTPIGRERVEFNANRVFDPRTILQCAKSNRLTPQQLTVITADGVVARQEMTEPNLLSLAQADYHLGLFTFTKSDR